MEDVKYKRSNCLWEALKLRLTRGGKLMICLGMHEGRCIYHLFVRIGDKIMHFDPHAKYFERDVKWYHNLLYEGTVEELSPTFLEFIRRHENLKIINLF